MNRLLTICLLLLASINLRAQELSAGLRANAGYWLQNSSESRSQIEARDGEHMSVNHEVFIRYVLKHKWLFEASFTKNDYDAPVQVLLPGCIEYGNGDTLLAYSNSKRFEFSLAAQYKIFGGPSSKSSFFRRINSYAGVSIGIMRAQYEMLAYSSSQPETDAIKLGNKSTEFWAGLNYALSYDLSKRFTIVSGAYCKLRPGMVFSNGIGYNGPFEPVMKFGLQLGAAYRIF